MINSAHSDVGLTKIHKRKTHFRTLYLYAFDRRLVDRKLEAENDGSFELGASMDQKWADVARRIGIRKAVGRQPKKINDGQRMIVKLAPFVSIILKGVYNSFPISKSIT